MSTWSKEVMSDNLKKLMVMYEKTQKEMAEIAGVSPPTFNDWLKCKKYPRIDKIERIAEYFGILKSDLIEDKENIKKSIEENPIEYAQEIASIIKNKELMDLIRVYIVLDETKKKQLKDFASFLKGS